MSSPPPLGVLISVRPRLFASTLSRLLDSTGRYVTVIDPDDQAVDERSYDVAVVSDQPPRAAPGAAVIQLPHPEQHRPVGTLRIGSCYEIVPIRSTADLVALIDRAATAAHQQG